MTKTNNFPSWDLSDLYSGIDDKKINADLEAYKKSSEAFAAKYKGNLKNLTSSEFSIALEEFEKIDIIGSIIGNFAYLNMCTQMKNDKAMAFYQNISEKLTDYAKPTIFLSLEINALDDNQIQEWLKDKKVAKLDRKSVV